MSLRKRPIMTPAMVAAKPRQPQKSTTGPRMVPSKNRSVVKALKHSRCACNFRKNPLRAKSKEDADMFQWIMDHVHAGFRFRDWQAKQRWSRTPGAVRGSGASWFHTSRFFFCYSAAGRAFR